eukprot:GHRR01021398.1.p1 GENE.GHRR01021398.1~~GHRR01021398.1.p1  ORF type:complete len:188 (-),score=50.72 GHRR01021398.1:1216-1779(-)
MAVKPLGMCHSRVSTAVSDVLPVRVYILQQWGCAPFLVPVGQHCLCCCLLPAAFSQYKFGARTGTAPVLLGVLKIALALLFGSSVLQLLQHFPQPLLGAMMLMAGLELAASARKETSARGCSFMLLTTATILGLGNTATGFVVGLGGYVLVLAYEWCCSRVARLALSTEGKKDDTKYALVPREVVSQ